MAKLNKTPLTIRAKRGTEAEITSYTGYQLSGEIAYATDTEAFFVSNGTTFVPVGGGTLQSVTDAGSTTTNDITIGTTVLRSGSYLNVKPVSNYGIIVRNSGDDNKYISMGVPGDYGFIKYKENTGSAVTINSTGVGIGTTAPTEKLEVAGKAIIRKSGTATPHGDTDFLVTDSTAALSTAQMQILGGNNASSILYFSDTDAYNIGGIKYKHSDNSMRLQVNGGEKVIITDTGNVGIGTTAPLYYPLTIEPNGTSNYIELRGSGNAGLYAAGKGLLAFDTSQNFIVYTGGINERMRVTSAGNVGIGTTAPAHKLDVNGDISLPLGNTLRWGNQLGIRKDSNGELNFFAGTNSTNGGFNFIGWNGSAYESGTLVIRNNGNVGIGTTAPTQKLHVDGNIRTSSSTGIGVGTDTVYSNSVNINNSGQYRIGNAEFISKSANDMSIYQGRMWVTNSRNVGIGTTAPSEKLDVQESTLGNDILNVGYTSDLSSWQGTGTVLKATSTYNATWNAYLPQVGIGTETPEYTLDIRQGGPLAASINLQGTYAQSPYLRADSYYGTIEINNRGWFRTREKNGQGGDFIVYTGIEGNTSWSAKFIVDNSGRVGIGTTSPSGHLHVIDSGNLSSGGVFIENTGTKSATLGLENTEGISKLFTNNGITTLRNTRSGFSNYSIDVGGLGVKIKEGNGGQNSHASAILDIDSTTQGVLFPRMTEVQKDSISSPATGLIIYQTDAQEGLYIHKSSGWTQII